MLEFSTRLDFASRLPRRRPNTLFVVLWFMHVTYSSRLTWPFAVAGLPWLALMIGVTMADFDTRGWS